jgi:polysaccharide biosynthesis protein PslJ
VSTLPSRPGAPPRLHAGWPLSFLFLGFPLWWALGIGAFVWPMVAVPMGLVLLMRGWARVPRGFGLWILFLVWMLASATQLDEPQRWIVFVYRLTIYGSATILFLYVYNMPREELTSRDVILKVTAFWAFAVLAGLLTLIFPDASFHSLAELVLPGGVVGNQFVYELVHPELAQVQHFLGYAVARPKAPFIYTNEWGANMALLTPFALAAWRTVRRKAGKLLVGGLLVASVAPIVVSLNRGLWLSLSVGLVYAAIRSALRGRIGIMRVVVVLALIGTVLVVTTPLGQLVLDRLATPHSNEGRLSLYSEAAESVSDSPLLGYGAPRPSERDPNLPRVGTHGQLWLVLFSHGIPAAGFFVGWFAFAFWRSRRTTSDVSSWMHVVLLITLVQMSYYGMVPVPIHIAMLAAAIAWREISAGEVPTVAASPREKVRQGAELSR